MKKQKKIILLSVAIIVFLLLLCTVSIAVSIWSYGGIDEKRQADVAIVLGAGTADGEVSPVYRERINHGILLYEDGYVGALILTGGVGDGNESSDAYAAKLYAMEQGVPEDDIFIEEKSTITEENFLYAREIMNQCGFGDAIVVSDPLHMKRSMLMAEDYGIKAYSSPTETTMYRSLRTQLSFLAREEFFYIGYSIVRLLR